MVSSWERLSAAQGEAQTLIPPLLQRKILIGGVECNLPRGDFQLFSMEIEKHMGFITSPSHLKHILVLGLPQDLSPIFAHLSECVTVVIDFKTHGNPQAPSHLSADFNYTVQAALFPEALRRWELFFELPQGGRVRKCYSF